VSAFTGTRRACKRTLDAVRKRRAGDRQRRATSGEGGGHSGERGAGDNSNSCGDVDGAAAALLSAGGATTCAPVDSVTPGGVGSGVDDGVSSNLDGWLDDEAARFLQNLLGGEANAAGADAWRAALQPTAAAAGGATPGGPPSWLPPALPALQPPLQPPLPLVARLTMTIKVPGVAPHELPSTLALDLARWLAPRFGGMPPVINGTVQPGCTLLTVDIAAVMLTRHRQDRDGKDDDDDDEGRGEDAASLAAFLLSGADAPFWSSHAFSIADSGGGAVEVVHAGSAPEPPMAAALRPPPPPLPPLSPAAVLCDRAVLVRSVRAAPAGGRLRCRMNGQLVCAGPSGAPLLPDATAGSPLRLTLPATHASGVALLDWAPPPPAATPAAAAGTRDGGAPRAVLLAPCAAVAAEVSRALRADADAPGRDALLFALGTALRRGAPAGVVFCAAAHALAAGWAATSGALLGALRDACARADATLLADGDADDDAVADDDLGMGTTLLHVAAASGRSCSVRLVLSAAADAGKHANSAASAQMLLRLLGTPAVRMGVTRYTPLHAAAAALAAARGRAAIDAAAAATALTRSAGDAPLAWFSSAAGASDGACVTPAALAARSPGGAALNAALAARVRAASATARAASSAPASPRAVAALLMARPSAPAAARRACCNAAARIAAELRALPLVATFRTALGYDDPVERAAFQAHAAARALTLTQGLVAFVVVYLVLVMRRRKQLHTRLARDYLLALGPGPPVRSTRFGVGVGGVSCLQMSYDDEMQVYFGESNAWLRLPVTAAMIVALLPLRPLRAWYLRHSADVLTVFWVVHFLASQMIKERTVLALYDLPVPLAWSCNGNYAQLFVTFCASLYPLRASRMCILLAARAVLPFAAPYCRCWFVMGDCADGALPAAPANAVLVALGVTWAVWSERRALHQFRAWNDGAAQRAPAPASAAAAAKTRKLA
jgi:hypothetical protein